MTQIPSLLSLDGVYPASAGLPMTWFVLSDKRPGRPAPCRLPFDKAITM